MQVVIVVGSTGAGKTTYSKALAAKIKAEVFSIDDWMKALYWQEMPPNPDNNWFVENGKWYIERINRCEEFILKRTVDRFRRGEASILDLGFSTADHRVKFIQALQQSGASVVTHYLNVSPSVRWQRVEQRNREQGDTFVMTVDRGMFDYIESIFEPPTPNEGAKVEVIGE